MNGRQNKVTGAVLDGKVFFTLIVAFAMFGSGGCGKSTPPAGPPSAPALDAPLPPEHVDGLTPLKGSASFASQCPYGSLADAKPVDVSLWNCPTGVDTAELAQSLPTLIIMADCNKKYLSIRSEDRRTLDSLWETMPDGSFSVTVDGGLASFSNFSSSQPSCTTPTSVDLWGKIDCSDHSDPNRDRGTVKLEAIWHLGQGSTDGVNTDSVCKLPAAPATTQGCSIYAQAEIKQCQ